MENRNIVVEYQTLEECMAWRLTITMISDYGQLALSIALKGIEYRFHDIA